jgi:hypothetical protein
MIEHRSATDLTRVSLLAAVILVAGLTVGFVAGQAAPDLLGSVLGPAAIVESVSPELTEADDYGTRHPTITVPQLTEADDYGTRHQPAAPLTPADDYGIRHP